MRALAPVLRALTGAALAAAPCAHAAPAAPSREARGARMVMAPRPVRPPSGPNSPRCPRVRPAYGAPCGAAQENLACRYGGPPASGPVRSYTCRASSASRQRYWQSAAAAPEHRPLPIGPLPPPELPS